MRILFWIIVLPLLVFAGIFAANNRADISINLEPAPFVLSAPLYLVVLLSLLAGFLGGALTVWLGQAHWRRQARKRGRELERLQKEITQSRADNAGTPARNTERGAARERDIFTSGF